MEIMRMGNGFFNKEFTWGIVPATNGDGERYIVFLENGEKCGIQATREQIEETLKSAGFTIICC